MKQTIIKRCIFHFTISLTAAIVSVASQVTAQSTYTWTGTASGDWGNASNWDTPPAFTAGKEILFLSPGAANLATFLGISPITIGGLTFNSNADSDISVITASAATGGDNRILTFDNGADPVYITVEEGAEGNIQVAPGKARTTIRNDLIISHHGTGLLTYHINNWLDDEGQNRFVYKEGPGTLQFGVAGWKFGGGLVIRDGRVKVLRDDAFGTGALTMTGGGLSAIENAQRTFTNSYFLANNLIMSDDTDTGVLVFNAKSIGTLISNTVLKVRGNGLILQGSLGDDAMNHLLTKTGAGTLALAAGNSYGGGTTLEQGRIRIGNNNSLGTGLLSVTNGTLSSNNTAGRTLPNNYKFSNEITLGDIGDNGGLTFNGTGTLTGETTLNVVSKMTLSNAIGQEGGSQSLTKTGAASLTLTLNKINTFSGGLKVKEGILIVNNHEDRLGTGPVTLDGGTLRYIGTSAHATINRELIIGDAGGTLELNTNDRVITWANPVSGGGTFTKQGVGPLVFAAVNTHTGAIVVANGLLRIDGTHAGEGNIAIQSGGSLGGTGSAAGTCSAESGGMFDPGVNGIGTLTAGGVEMQAGAVFLWQLDETSSDTIHVDGDLSLPSSFAVNVTQLSPTTIKKRVLFTYSGSYYGPERADLSVTGDVEVGGQYQALHDSLNKQVLFVRKPEPAIMIIR